MASMMTEDGTEIFYRDWGAGRPVALIHGWPLTGEMWEKQSTFLAEHGCRVITYDRRGFGRSGQPWSGFGYDSLAADLDALMTKLDLRDATLVGFSMGGGEVIRYLSRYGSARVRKAVLVSAVTPYLLKTDDNPHGVDGSVFDKMLEQIRTDRPATLSDFGPRFYGRTAFHHIVSEAQLEWTQGMALTGSLRSTLETMKAWSTTDFREEMRSIPIPILVIHGTEDETVPIDASGRRSAELLNHATLSEYHGEPHGLFLTAADRLNEELLAFIRDGAAKHPSNLPASSKA